MFPNERRRHLSCSREARDVRNSPGVVGDLPVLTLDLTHPESVESVQLQPEHITSYQNFSVRPPSTAAASTLAQSSRQTFQKSEKIFLVVTIQPSCKRYNFDSIVGLINYGFTSIFLYLWEKIRLHILISYH